MMAGVKTSGRGKYTVAGYTGHDEYEALYIASAPAGSAQENLRDLNRKGYRSERPWHETPQPVFETMVADVPAQTVKRRAKTQKKRGFFELLFYHARKDRQGAAVCVALAFAMMMMVAAWGGEMVDGVVLARDIAMYQSQTRMVETENESLTRQLEMAKSGDRIRNLAQNELGMLRPERAHQETIYIRTTENVPAQTQQTGEMRMELLDVLLGLLNVFHIGE